MLVWISDLDMKKGFPEITGNPVCGAKGIRTPDPLHAMEMPPTSSLSGMRSNHLSYGPVPAALLSTTN